MATIKANFRIRSLDFAATAVDNANDRITITNHGLSEGDAVGVLPTAAGSLDTGLTSTTPYYVHVVDASTIELFTTYALAFAAGASVALNADQSGICRLYIGGIGQVLLDVVPTNALIKSFRYDVITTFTSHLEATGYDGAADDGAAIGVELNTISAARALSEVFEFIDEAAAEATISNAANGWDAPGSFYTAGEVSPIGTTFYTPEVALADLEILTNSDSYLTISIEDSGEVLTAGEANIFIEYDFTATSA